MVWFLFLSGVKELKWYCLFVLLVVDEMWCCISIVSDVVLIVNSSKNSLLCSLIILIEKGEIVFKVGSSKMDCMLG